MVFSFFRKDKQPNVKEAKAEKKSPSQAGKKPVETVAPKSVQPAQEARQDLKRAHDEPQTEIGLEGFSVSEGIEVSEGATDISSVAEEAAILYANDRADEAIATLHNHIKETSGQQDIQPWLMLFDLYQIQGLKQDFEELALDFVVKFERSAPIWTGREAAEIVETRTAKTMAGNYFALTGIVSSDSESQFQQMQQVVQKAGNLRLDLSKVKGMETSGSKLLLDALQKLRKAGVKIQYIGASNVIGLLKQTTQAGVGEGAQYHWLLLMEFDQILGKQEDFEELAIEYAVTFEVSPPSWEAPAEKADVEEASEPSSESIALPTVNSDRFVLKGVISGNSEHVLKGLAEYAESRQEAHVDMSRVARVDFICMGSFMNVLIQLSTSGKQIVIHEPNEMVLTLFRVMGVDQFATILRKKPR